jgi:hypothetical protein
MEHDDRVDFEVGADQSPDRGEMAPTAVATRGTESDAPARRTRHVPALETGWLHFLITELGPNLPAACMMAGVDPDGVALPPDLASKLDDQHERMAAALVLARADRRALAAFRGASYFSCTTGTPGHQAV